MADQFERYKKLGIRDSLSLSYRYPFVCRELGLILRLAFSKLFKPLQSLVFEDTIAAFRALPQMQTQSAVSAANLLIQSAEAAFPKQKRVVAVSEFKQAKVAHKRRSNTHQPDKDIVQLPQDVLLHLFSLLDMQSLVSAGLVCRSWNAAANDNYLWRFHYTTHFGNADSFLKIKGHQCGRLAEDRHGTPSNEASAFRSIKWKDAFRRAYKGLPSWRYKFNRGYCSHCNEVVWLSDLKCPNLHSNTLSQVPRMKPVSPSQIVAYIVDDSSLSVNSSDSDTDSDSEEPGFKLWAYRRHHQ